MTNSIKKKLQTVTKNIGYLFFSFFYQRIKQSIEASKHDLIDIIKVKIDKLYLYNIFKIKNCRIYTDTVTDTAFIIDDKVIEGPSFQHRNVKNSDIRNNIVFSKGTPKFKKKINGVVFSLLTGGGGNSNYWHWLFDVLPRFKIIDEKIDLKTIDFFLLPGTSEKFQNETLDLLGIPIHKRLSSRKFRHIKTELAIAVDHPYVLKNNPSEEIQKIPDWIIADLRKKFLRFTNKKKFPKKFYIDRKDSKSNHRHLRRVLNEDEVKNFLKKKDFEILTLSDFSFTDQVTLFNNASCIVGLHGAGFANLTFCKNETKILEFKSSTTGQVCENLAKKVNLNYEEITVQAKENDFQDQQGLITIPLNLLEKKIN